MVKVEIRCPTCSKRNKIEVSEEEVKNTTRGLYAVNVSEGIVCEHSFIAYLDKNLVVRDTFMADFQIVLPEQDEQEEIKIETPKPSEKVDLDIIKINITATMFAFMLRAILFRKKIVVISDKEFLADHLINLFKFASSDKFEINISFVPKNKYNPSDFGDHVVFDGSDIIDNGEKVIESKKIKVERTIIQAFLKDANATSSLNLLKNEIKKIHDLSLSIIDIVNNKKDNDKLYSKTLISELKKRNNMKIQVPYLDFLIEVVEHYFGMKVPLSSNISNFLGTL